MSHHLNTRNPLVYLWRHPRRTGFLTFNVAVIALLLGWGIYTATLSHEGIGALPNLVVGYTGMAVLFLAWVVGWIAWAIMVTTRHARHLRRAQTQL